MENERKPDCGAGPEPAFQRPVRPPLLRLPGNLDTGDLLLILIVFLVWLEKEDEEILILLSALLVMSL